MIAVAVLIVTSVVFGIVRLNRSGSAPTLRVAGVQDCTGDETADLAPAPAVDVNRDAMTRKARDAGARFVVWSEECLGNAFAPESRRDPTIALTKRLGIYLVAGFAGSERPKPYNSACLITPDGRVAGIHHKISLYAEERRLVRPGTVAQAFPTPLGPVGMEICFDTCNTSVTRRIAQSGARLIAVPTYDPPVVNGVIHNLHAALMPFRAVENAVPMVRDDSNGTSEVIDSYGRVLAIGPLYAPSTVMSDVPLGNGDGTFFTRAGDWFAYLCITYFC